MKQYREYEIAWLGLKESLHEFQYDVTDQVLEDLGYQNLDFDQVDVKVNLKFEKNNSFFILNFDLDGFINTTCDRCGDPLKLQLWDEFQLIIKLTENSEEAERENENEEADVYFLSRGETVINIFPWIYEFFMLSIPIQRIHPVNEEGKSDCNPEAIKLLEKMQNNAEPENPIWKDLDKFKT